MFSEIPCHFIGEIVDLLDNNTLNLVHARKVIAKLFDETNKSPTQVCNFLIITNYYNIINIFFKCLYQFLDCY